MCSLCIALERLRHGDQQKEKNLKPLGNVLPYMMFFEAKCRSWKEHGKDNKAV